MNVIENKGQYIFVNYDEPYVLKNAIALLKESAAACATNKCRKLLLNFVNMPGKVKTLDRFELGIQGAIIFRRLEKIAAVYRKEEMNLFLENVAVNRGLNIRIFSDMDTALKWLEVK